MNPDDFPFDYTALSIVHSHEEAEAEDRAFWFSKTPHERLIAAEKLRHLKYGKAAMAPMKRVIEITTWEPLCESPE